MASYLRTFSSFQTCILCKLTTPFWVPFDEESSGKSLIINRIAYTFVHDMWNLQTRGALNPTSVDILCKLVSGVGSTNVIFSYSTLVIYSDLDVPDLIGLYLADNKLICFSHLDILQELIVNNSCLLV